MEFDIIQILIQGGSVGVAIFALWVLHRIAGNFYKLVGNHLEHNTQAILKLVRVITKLNTWLRKNGKK